MSASSLSTPVSRKYPPQLYRALPGSSWCEIHCCRWAASSGSEWSHAGTAMLLSFTADEVGQERRELADRRIVPDHGDVGKDVERVLDLGDHGERRHRVETIVAQGT